MARSETIVNNCVNPFLAYKFLRILNFADIKFRVYDILKISLA